MDQVRWTFRSLLRWWSRWGLEWNLILFTFIYISRSEDVLHFKKWRCFTFQEVGCFTFIYRESLRRKPSRNSNRLFEFLTRFPLFTSLWDCFFRMAAASSHLLNWNSSWISNQFVDSLAEPESSKSLFHKYYKSRIGVNFSCQELMEMIIEVRWSWCVSSE